MMRLEEKFEEQKEQFEEQKTTMRQEIVEDFMTKLQHCLKLPQHEQQLICRTSSLFLHTVNSDISLQFNYPIAYLKMDEISLFSNSLGQRYAQGSFLVESANLPSTAIALMTSSVATTFLVNSFDEGVNYLEYGDFQSSQKSLKFHRRVIKRVLKIHNILKQIYVGIGGNRGGHQGLWTIFPTVVRLEDLKKKWKEDFNQIVSQIECGAHVTTASGADMDMHKATSNLKTDKIACHVPITKEGSPNIKYKLVAFDKSKIEMRHKNFKKANEAARLRNFSTKQKRLTSRSE
ncbi:hypothetical protein RND71_002423 [Anisodus tanguticus]|uniref:Uncharacterized protein n=1 Tax=Anisodus tanguticus TaxID=243964 RepID=A0AAE1VWJ7_9SOLA|nr:hypothetical protein RND71_002423 [Anisodus tanguticus]